MFETENSTLKKRFIFLRLFAYYMNMWPSERERVYGHSIRIYLLSTAINMN